jgi:restriction endonuclease S subunit
MFPVNSVLIAMYGATIGKVGMLGIEASTNQAVCAIFPNEKCITKYLYYIMRSQKKKLIELSVGGAQPNISQTIIKNFEIPLPSIENQNQIVGELDSYQKVIDGSKQVIENYKPLIDIDPNWEIVELGKIADIVSGQSPPSSSYNKSKKGLPFYQGKTDYGDIYLLETDTYTSEVTKVSKKNDIIMSVRAPVGPVNLNPFNEICIGRGLCAIRPKNKEDLEFIFNYLQTDDVVKGHMGSTYESINRDEILKIKIPNPDKEIKNNIINIILDERKIIEGNKKIIEKFTQKVIDRINKIWSN